MIKHIEYELITIPRSVDFLRRFKYAYIGIGRLLSYHNNIRY